MTYKAYRILSVLTALVTANFISPPTALADDWNYHGTECITANLAQGQLFSWNKDGITNNFAIPLFVICPMSFDDDEVALFATPQFSVSVSVFLPGTMAAGTSVGCFVRYFNATDTNAQADDTQVAITTQAFAVGSQDFPGTGENDVSTQTFIAANADLGTAHLLCLLPGGATLRAYDADFFD